MLDYLEYRLHKTLLFYVPPLLIAIGTVGNSLSFCVLMRRGMRGLSTYNFLAVLSLTDLLVLYIGLLRRWLGEITGGDVRDRSDWGCKVISVVGYTVSMYSVWLLISVTVERYIVTVHPLHAPTMCTRKRAWRVIAGILFIITFINIHFLFTTEIRAYQFGRDYVLACSSAVGWEYLVEVVWPWIDACFYCFAPFVIICILNARIVYKVVQSSHRRDLRYITPSNNNTSPACRSNHGSHESSVRLTAMLLSVSFAFLLCTFPMNVTMIYRAHWEQEDTSFGSIARYTLTRTISELLMYTQHSINFFLYLVTGHRFRQELLRMFCFCRERPLPPQPPPHHDHHRDSASTQISFVVQRTMSRQHLQEHLYDQVPLKVLCKD